MAINNIAEHLIIKAQESPNRPAVICALGKNSRGRRSYTLQTFDQLNQESAAIALWLKELGIQPGTKAVVMVKPGPELFALTFGLFKAGIVPVLIDPGMDKSALKECITAAKPELFIGIPLAHIARKVLGWAKKSLKLSIMVGGPQSSWKKTLTYPFYRWLAQRNLDEAMVHLDQVPSDYLAQDNPHSLAAILYTSGSTGIPKGAMYKHRHFIAQVDLLKASYDFREGAFDVPTFPLFALFDPALGMSAVFPIMDYAAPAKADPNEIFSVIDDFGAENLFCSPALLRRLATSLKTNPRPLPTLKRVISAGAPVPVEEMKIIKEAAHSTADIYTPYGATESLPLSSISCSEVLERGYLGQTQGRGVCVGKTTPGVNIRLIKVTDEAIESWSDAELIERPIHSDEAITPFNAYDRIGEIVVYGPSTTQAYLSHPQGDTLSKIKGPPPQVALIEEQSVSHRMGDLGYIDEAGFIWVCGRKSHRIDQVDKDQELRWLPHCVEGPINQINGVFRSALVDSIQGPVICIELKKNAQWDHVIKEIKDLADQYVWLKMIYGFIRHPNFPVDTRHNAKIKREKLKLWLQTRLTSTQRLF
ncbi:MAG: peptide synthase [Myxococcales bacterium]|nr:peptide synthase [Myxococcales bacterium]